HRNRPSQSSSDGLPVCDRSRADEDNSRGLTVGRPAVTTRSARPGVGWAAGCTEYGGVEITAFARRRRGTDGNEKFLSIYLDVHGQKRSAGSFETQEKAVEAAIRQGERQTLGQIGDRRLGKQTFGSYVLDTWLPNDVMELSTRQSYTYELKRHILPAFATMRMSKITPSDVRT
ncbi:MAG TPA: N-terminal phage integrase SAM-like domain-containing protein, partial [Actinocrinis sp.]